MSTDPRVRRMRTIRGAAVVAAVAVGASTLSLVPATAGNGPDIWSPSTWQGVVAGPPVPAQGLPPAPVPATPAGLPATYDIHPEYEGQAQCDPDAKPGAQRLADLIKATYGADQTVWIPRNCSVGGQSEHKEGRALDWMTSARDPQGRANAEAFLQWLLGPDQFGVEYGNAFRLGIMYIAWNDRLWRTYDLKRGWTEMKGCFSRTSRGHDTVCHRDHIHISLTWDGATGKTSFWDGSPMDAPFCPRTTTGATTQVSPRGEVVPITPVRVIDTVAGLGVERRCRLQQDRWAGDSHRLFAKVTGVGGVPASGVSGVQVRIGMVESNAPATLRAWSPGQTSSQPVVRVDINGSGEGTAVLPVSSDGTIALATTAGATDVTVDVLGWFRADGQGAPNAGGTGPAPALEPVPEFIPLGSVIAYESAVQGGPLKAGESRTVDLAGLPADATSALVFVTARDQSANGRLRIGRVDKSATAELAFPRKRMKKSVMLVPVSGGKAVLEAPPSSAVNVRVEVLGYAKGAGVPRTRVVSPQVMFRTKLDAGEVETYQAARRLGMPGPKRLTGVLLRVVTRKADANGTVSVYAPGGTPPGTRSAPVVANTQYAALIAAPIDADGKVAVTSTTDARVEATVVGFVTR